jgi:hypothetical protein
MEVTVLLEDRRSIELTGGLSKRLGGPAFNAREGAVNPVAPACSMQFGTNTGGEDRIRTCDASPKILQSKIFRAIENRKSKFNLWTFSIAV